MGELKGAMTLNAVPNLFVLLTHPNLKQLFQQSFACIILQHASLISYYCPQLFRAITCSTFACEHAFAFVVRAHRIRASSRTEGRSGLRQFEDKNNASTPSSDS
jgi:hypothetical protein